MARRTGVPRAVLIAALLGAPGPVHAEESPALTVDRGPSADDCPDAALLKARIEGIRGRPGLGHTRYRVWFERETPAYRVTISADPGGGERTLESSDANCSALGRAAAVTLAVLFDSEPDDTKPSAPPAAPRAKPSGDEPRPRVQRSPSRTPRLETTLAVSAVGVAGVLGPAALGAAGEIGLIDGPFRAALGALWLPSKALPLGPGEVREELIAGRARLCVAPARGKDLRVDACTGFLAGVLDARGVGYSLDTERHRAWLAVPVEVTGTLWTGPVGWELGAGAVFAVHRNDFGIEGLGVAYSSPSVAGLLSLGVVGKGPAF